MCGVDDAQHPRGQPSCRVSKLRSNSQLQVPLKFSHQVAEILKAVSPLQCPQPPAAGAPGRGNASNHRPAQEGPPISGDRRWPTGRRCANFPRQNTLVSRDDHSGLLQWQRRGISLTATPPRSSRWGDSRQLHWKGPQRCGPFCCTRSAADGDDAMLKRPPLPIGQHSLAASGLEQRCSPRVGGLESCLRCRRA